MRVLIVASWYPTARAPIVGSFIREQSVALAQRGLEVHIISFDRDPRLMPLSVRHREDSGTHVHSISVPWLSHRMLGFYLPRLLSWRVTGLIRQLQPTIIHAHAVRPAGVLATLATQSLAVPVLLTEHKGDLRAYWATMHGYRQIVAAYRKCRRLYAVSENARERMESAFPATRGKWRVLYNGIDMNLFSMSRKPCLPRSDKGFRLLFLGGIDENKGLRVVFQAMRQLPERFCLTVAGPGASPQRILALAKQYGVEARIEGVGLVSRQRVAELLSMHDALIVASYHETFGLVCAEALACGTPVIATRCGGPEEIVRHPFGELVQPGNFEELANGILRISVAAPAWNPRAAREYICDRFSLLAVARRLQREYEEVLEATP